MSGEGPRGPVFVTGATGFIGRHLVRALLAEERPVTALCRDPRAASDLAHPLLTVVPGDLEDESSWRPHLGPGVTVFHLAALRAFAGVSRERFHAVNVRASAALGRAALQARVPRFVYISSALVYGPSGGTRRSEQDPPPTGASAGHYLESRVAAFREMAALASAGLPVITACPSHVYGPDHPHSPNRLTSQIRRLLRSRVGIVIGGGNSRRSLAYVEDVARGLLLAEKRGIPGESYILSGEDASHREFDRLVRRLAGKPDGPFLSVPLPLALAAARLADRLRGYDRGAGHATAVRMLCAEWCYSSEKASNLLGYAPVSLALGLGKTLCWLGFGAAGDDGKD